MTVAARKYSNTMPPHQRNISDLLDILLRLGVQEVWQTPQALKPPHIKTNGHIITLVLPAGSLPEPPADTITRWYP